MLRPQSLSSSPKNESTSQCHKKEETNAILALILGVARMALSTEQRLLGEFL